MTATFTPLLPGPGASPSGPAGQALKPGMEAKAFCAVATGNSPVAGTEPKVTVERDGDRVRTIRIQCPCGHVTELNCVYD